MVGSWNKDLMEGAALFISSFSTVRRLAHGKNKNGQPLPGAKQFRRNQFSTSADFLFLLLFSKQLRRNQFST
jgi:hypothetical protein